MSSSHLATAYWPHYGQQWNILKKLVLLCGGQDSVWHCMNLLTYLIDFKRDILKYHLVGLVVPWCRQRLCRNSYCVTAVWRARGCTFLCFRHLLKTMIIHKVFICQWVSEATANIIVKIYTGKHVQSAVYVHAETTAQRTTFASQGNITKIL